MLSRQMVLRALACLLIGVLSAVSVHGQTLTVNDAVVNLSSPPLTTGAGVFLPLEEAASAVGVAVLGRATASSACLWAATGLVRIGPQSLLVEDETVYIRARALAEAVEAELHTVAGSVFIELVPPELHAIEQGAGGDELVLRLSSYTPIAVVWEDDVTLRLRMPICAIASSFEARTRASNHVVSVRALPASSSSVDVRIWLTQPLPVAVEAQPVLDGFAVRVRFGERELQEMSFPLNESSVFYSWKVPTGGTSAVVEGVWVREWRSACRAVIGRVSTPAPSDVPTLERIVSASVTPIDSIHEVPAGFAMTDGSILDPGCGTSGAVCIDLFGRLEFADLPPVAVVSFGEVVLTSATNRPAADDELLILQPGYSGLLSASPQPLRVVTVRNGYITSVVDSRYPNHDPSRVTIVASGSARELLATVHVGTPVCVTTTVEEARTFESIAGGGILALREGSVVGDGNVSATDWAWTTVVADDWAGGLGVLSIHVAGDDRTVDGLVGVLSQLPLQLMNAVLFRDGSLVVWRGDQEIPLVEPASDEIRFTVIPRTP